jgi:hypothetical protein
MNKFLTQMAETLIPAVERMVEKEQSHLEYLKNFEPKNAMLHTFVKRSENSLAHLNKRLSEYRQYVLDNKNN